MTNGTRSTDAPPAPFAFQSEAYPEASGCYLFRDSQGRLLYVGKAVNLRRRLASYFRTSNRRHRKAEMIGRIRGIEVILARNEREALVLESNLIRHHRPAFNSRFARDDDSYYYIARTEEAFPRFVPYRKRRANYALVGASIAVGRLFGPYVGWRLRNRILDALRAEFPLRVCHSLPSTPCARGASGACAAPCVDRITEKAYRTLVRDASRFLRRPPAQYLRALEEDMREASARRDYERAGTLRDRLVALEHAAAPQVAERSRNENVDVQYSGDGFRLTLHVRGGVIVGLGSLASIEDRSTGVRPLDDRASAGVQADRIIANRTLRVGSHGQVVPVCVPRTVQSYAGQLLEICRINHAYRIGIRQAASRLSPLFGYGSSPNWNRNSRNGKNPPPTDSARLTAIRATNACPNASPAPSVK